MGLCLALLVPACSDEASQAPRPPGDDPGCLGASCGACPAPFVAHPSGDGCIEVAAATCGDGSMPLFGDTECRPVGWVGTCPAGTQAEAWGCIDVQPAEPCAGHEMEVLGYTDCQPIGDCAAPWPPAGATHFVDAGLLPGDVDATHFTSIAAAVEAAPNGAVIAIEAGTYVESLEVTRSVELVGRCAAHVILDSPAGDAPGIAVFGVDGVVVAGITVRGHRAGVGTLGGQVTVRDALIEDNWLVGVVATEGGRAVVERSRVVDTHELGGEFGHAVSCEGGSSIEVFDSALVRGTSHAAGAIGAGSSVAITRTIVRDTLPGAANVGKGIAVEGGATGAIVDSAIVANQSANVSVSGQGTTLSLSGSVIRDATAAFAGEGGNGLQVFEGAEATVDDSAFIANAGWGLVSQNAGTQLVVNGATVRGREGSRGLGACALDGASLDLRDTAIVDVRDAGVLVENPGSFLLASGVLVRGTRLMDPVAGYGFGAFAAFGGVLEMVRSTLSDNDRVGLLVGGDDAIGGGGSVAHVADALVLRSVPIGAAAVFGRGVEVIHGGTLTIERSAIVDNVEAGLGAGMPGSSLSAIEVVVRGTRAAGGFGHGAMALGGASLLLRGSHLSDNGATGLLFSASAGVVEGGTVAHNAIGIHAQDGSTLEEVGQVPEGLEPLRVRVDSRTRFLANGTRVGSGSLPVPLAVGASAR